jgi:hypothetical protein
MTDLRTAAQQAHDRAKWINDEQAIVSYEDMMDLRNALGQQEQEPVAWRYQNSNTDHVYLVWEKGTGGRNWTPLYTHPPRREPEPPPEPISDAKIRAEFLDINRHTLPGETAAEDWFEAGVRYAERQHEIV